MIYSSVGLANPRNTMKIRRSHAKGFKNTPSSSTIPTFKSPNSFLSTNTCIPSFPPISSSYVYVYVIYMKKYYLPVLQKKSIFVPGTKLRKIFLNGLNPLFNKLPMALK
jgi:hypothetical protein